MAGHSRSYDSRTSRHIETHVPVSIGSAELRVVEIDAVVEDAEVDAVVEAGSRKQVARHAWYWARAFSLQTLSLPRKDLRLQSLFRSRNSSRHSRAQPFPC